MCYISPQELFHIIENSVKLNRSSENRFKIRELSPLKKQVVNTLVLAYFSRPRLGQLKKSKPYKFSDCFIRDMPSYDCLV